MSEGLKLLSDPYWSSRVLIGAPDECWPCGSSSHYGKAGGTTAHRWTWMLLHGEIPDGLLVCHTCDNPPCCNPGHLFLGTAKDNVRDAMNKGRRPRVTDERMCPRGHAYDEANTYWTPAGRRQCKKCRALYQRSLRRARTIIATCPDCGIERSVDSNQPGIRCRPCAARRMVIIRMEKG